MSTPRSTPSPHLVLPPIVANDKDRDFLVALNAHIDSDLGMVNSNNPEQRYIVYKSAFDKIIDYVTAYKPLLTAVKAEYEDCIETIQRGQREAFYLSGKVKAMVNEPSTIRNYKKRSQDLDQKLSVIEEDNGRLREQLENLREARLEKERQAKETAEPLKKVIKRDKRAKIPGLTLQQSTDLKTLQKELEKLERQFRELTISHRTRYSPKEHQVNLKSVLDEKVSLRDQLQEQTELMKMKRQKLKIALEAAQAYMKIQPPHQTIGESVVSALQRARTQNQLFMEKGPGDEGMPRGTPSTTFEEDDPTREKEAEMMLEYIEKFNELLEDKKYEEAAIHAANSPKGILRTPETLQRFKVEVIYQITDMKGMQTGSGRTPLLAYCDALMATVLAYGVTPSDYMSVECVKCALDENRMDLVSHWISQDRLTNTVQLGDLIYRHCVDKPQSTKSCLSLAQRVYSEAEAYVPAAVCMIRLGRVNQAMEYAQKNEMQPAQYIALLKQCPGPQLAKALLANKYRGNSLLPLGVIVTNLLKTDIEANVGLYLIQDIYLHGPQDPGKDSSPIRKAVFEDKITTEEQWVDIVQKLQEVGYSEAGIDILAAVTVYNAVSHASKYAEEIEKEKQAEKKAEKQEAIEKPVVPVKEKSGPSVKERRKGREKERETDDEEKEEGKKRKRKSKGKKKKRIVEEISDKSDGYDPDDAESDYI